MIEWVSSAPTFLVATLLAVGIGFPVAWALGFKGLNLIATSVGASFLVIALAAPAASLIGMQWTILPVFIMVAMITAIGAGVRWGYRNAQRIDLSTGRETYKAAGIGLLISAAVIALTLVKSIGNPHHISQNYDTPFHLNLVTHILEEGNASPLNITLVSSEGSGSFYPSVWHGFTALVTQLSGSTVVEASNVVNIVIAALIWPVGMIFLTRTLFPRATTLPLFVGAVLPLFASFPYRFFIWGLLYPNLLSTALLPIALALFLSVSRQQQASLNHRFVSFLAGLGVLGAAALAHPNALYSAAIFLVPLAVWITYRKVSQHGLQPATVKSLLGTLSIILITIALWFFVITGDNTRAYDVDFIAALKEGLVTSPLVSTDMWLLGAVVLFGAALLIRRKEHSWLPVSYAIALILFAISMGPDTAFRSALTQAWYNDAHRLAAILPIFAAPLAAFALHALYVRLTSVTNQVTRIWHPKTLVAICGATTLLYVGHLLPIIQTDIRSNFTIDEASAFVTPDEKELFERLPEHTTDEDLIAGDPWNGSVYIYTLTQRDFLYPHLKGDFGEEAVELAQIFNEDTTRACELIQSLGVTHFVGSEHPLYMDGRDLFPGLEDLGNSPLLTEIDRIGGASLYTVTGCH